MSKLESERVEGIQSKTQDYEEIKFDQPEFDEEYSEVK